MCCIHLKNDFNISQCDQKSKKVQCLACWNWFDFYYCVVLYLTKCLWNVGISESMSRSIFFCLFWSTVHTFQVSHLKIFFSIKPSCMNGNYSSLERHFFGCLINNFFENFVHLSSKYYDEPKKIHFHCVSFLSKDDD